MAEPVTPPQAIKPLADWKTWWGADLALTIAKSVRDHVKVLPDGGKLIELPNNKVAAADLENDRTALLAEGLLKSYPFARQPSAYLLGDAVLYVDALWGNGLLGPPSSNPMEERARRERALKEGGKLKLLLSYARTSGCKNEQGKHPNVTYLKKLANLRRSPSAKSHGSSIASAPSKQTGLT